jgi:hypothetical protein
MPRVCCDFIATKPNQVDQNKEDEMNNYVTPNAIRNTYSYSSPFEMSDGKRLGETSSHRHDNITRMNIIY